MKTQIIPCAREGKVVMWSDGEWLALALTCAQDVLLRGGAYTHGHIRPFSQYGDGPSTATIYRIVP